MLAAMSLLAVITVKIQNFLFTWDVSTYLVAQIPDIFVIFNGVIGYTFPWVEVPFIKLLQFITSLLNTIYLFLYANIMTIAFHILHELQRSIILVQMPFIWVNHWLLYLTYLSKVASSGEWKVVRNSVSVI